MRRSPPFDVHQTLFGVSTSYRREADGSLSVKIEGELRGVPLFEQLAVLREVDLYQTWVSCFFWPMFRELPMGLLFSVVGRWI